MSIRNRLSLSKKRLGLAAWLVAALLILAVAGSETMTLLSAPPPAESQELRSVRRKLRELEAVAVVPLDLAGEAEKLERVFGGTDAASAAPAPAEEALAGEVLEEEAPLLPRLSGIVRIQGADGRLRYRAMLDGRDLGERDKVDGFTVQRISQAGVVLAGAGRQWTLAAPDAALTVRQQ